MADYDDGWSPQECGSIDASGNRDFENPIYGDGKTVKISDLTDDNNENEEEEDDDEQIRKNDENGGSSPVNDG